MGPIKKNKKRKPALGSTATGPPRAPRGNVTINPPPTLEKERKGEKKIWMITLKSKNIPFGSLNSWIKEHCECATYQKEQGEENNYFHYQITMHLLKKQRLTWIKNHFSNIAHCEIVNNVDAAFDYTTKSNTRIGEAVYYPERIKQVKDPLEGIELYTWQKHILDILEKEPDNRTINWFWEPNGCAGKTSIEKHLMIHKQGIYFVSGGKNADALYSIEDDIKILVYNIPRSAKGYCPYSVLEQIKDGLVFSSKYKSGCKIFNSPHILVFSNTQPDYAELSEDRWNVIRI